ncbi:MAG: hypothetical protein S4CHLAM20_10840 [Chlamydiia bacterium]|nr:hypothetical protein [Chlamydiia bacterium]
MIISGIVTELSTGLPITGATITMMQNMVSSGTATTNADGEYSIEILTPGSYVATVNAVGFLATYVNTTLMDNDITIDFAMSVLD